VKAWVTVTLKPEVLDPQGKAIAKASTQLGVDAVRSVRQGKLFEIELDADDEATARRLLEELSEKLLANPVIEDHRVVSIEA
jgi:phosphoribosylformylglycinamidine synthase PurS subunit